MPGRPLRAARARRRRCRRLLADAPRDALGLHGLGHDARPTVRRRSGLGRPDRRYRGDRPQHRLRHGLHQAGRQLLRLRQRQRHGQPGQRDRERHGQRQLDHAGGTAVALTAGSYSAGGTAYDYRSAVETAATTLSAGSKSYTITSTDKAANAGTQTFTTVVDNTPPTAIDVQSTNVSGGTVGRLDKGDTLTLTYSGAIDPYSVLTGWTGATTNVQVALVDGGGTIKRLPADL